MDKLLSRTGLSLSLSQPSAGVLPLRGGRTHAPSSVLVRARLDDGRGASRGRAAMGFFAAVCDDARTSQDADARWWSFPVEVPLEATARTAALSLTEAEDARADLEATGLLLVAERGYRIDADVLCECPALDLFDWDAARERLREQNRLVGPATMVLREIIRGADRSGACHTTIPRLLEATLYGRTRITQALALLEQVRLVVRSDLPNRMVRFQLIQGSETQKVPAPSPSRPARSSAQGTRMRLPVNAPIEIAGERIEVTPGIVPELELDADGRYFLWLGPVRIGPYLP